MLRERTGRVTFMPLNRLHPTIPPAPNAQDAIPLLSKLRFDNAHLKAFQQVFGKTCVCRDLTIAAAYVKSHGINTITLDGDKVDRKGALTGGFYDVRRSRLEAINSVMTWKSKLTADDKRLTEVTTAIQQAEQEITRLVGRVQVLGNQQNQARAARETVAEESSQYLRERERLVTRIERLEGEVFDLEAELKGLQAKLEAYRTEMASPLANGLSTEEEDLIEALGKDIEQRHKTLLEYGKTKNEVSNPSTVSRVLIANSLLNAAWETQKHD